MGWFSKLDTMEKRLYVLWAVCALVLVALVVRQERASCECLAKKCPTWHKPAYIQNTCICVIEPTP